jgi:hypothetical protein
MLADTSDLVSLRTTQRRHADDLASVAADLTNARVPPDAFGAIGSGFLAALNDALLGEASRVAQLAERLAAAASTTAATVHAYESAEAVYAQSISALGR